MMKYTAISQRSFTDLLIVSDYFTFSASFIFVICLQSLMYKQILTLISILYIIYFEFLLYNVINWVGNIYWQTFLFDVSICWEWHKFLNTKFDLWRWCLLIYQKFLGLLRIFHFEFWQNWNCVGYFLIS